MAKRPVFIPALTDTLVRCELVEFVWHAGFAPSQKRKNIEALHHEARKNLGLNNLLEISTKSLQEIGVSLSAFNLKIILKNGKQVSVEAAFQSSKVFEFGGPYRDLLGHPPRAIKKDARLKESGALLFFEFEGVRWALQPRTAFYDWLYLTALVQNPGLSRQLLSFDGFTDIEFNPTRQINCQARSAALFVSLTRQGLLEQAMKSKNSFLELVEHAQQNHGSRQLNLFEESHKRSARNGKAYRK